VDLRVDLKAEKDLDIRIYNQNNTSRFPEGEAIVAWCSPAATCNKGVISSQNLATAEYAGMQVRYSGYNGVNDQKGNEFIDVDSTTVPIKMTAFAFATGPVRVTYSWSKTVSPCCLGTAACEGDFQKDVQKDAVITLGEIPAGVKDLKILLDSTTDVDIQLYDIADGQEASIIRWCGVFSGPDCVAGTLGLDEGFNTAEYKGLTYSYSGYYGTEVDGEQKRGNEYIEISGTTNTPLLMKVFGFDQGTAEVTYTYWN